jgi:hypothetical protein
MEHVLCSHTEDKGGKLYEPEKMAREHFVGNIITTSPYHCFTNKNTSNTNKKECKERSFPFSHGGFT